jgi:hypothetical protein
VLGGVKDQSSSIKKFGPSIKTKRGEMRDEE